ncbi:glycosyltransferase [Trichocoleus desertorum AS-A10]|uniref:glycosyltransferase family protein n=1 Tax=Trichocoleus desertorum TaxID=1481672 RepID=UPI003297A1A3
MNNQTLGTYTFLMEQSPTPIYQRIIDNLEGVLTQLGNKVIISCSSNFRDQSDYLRHISSQKIDYCIITNSPSMIASYYEALEAFMFELVDTPVIFIHHDSIFSDLHKPEKIKLKLEAFYRMRAKSFHFCIEYYNFLDLKALEIENVYLINHASEFEYVKPSENHLYDVSFVGHILPELGNALGETQYSYLLKADFWNRLVQLDTKLEQSAISFAKRVGFTQDKIIDFLGAKYLYISMLHSNSSFCFRGEIVKRIENANVHVFGGDPAYLNGVALTRKIQNPNIFYHPATRNYSDTRYIYANSKINLNITSLQFDDAVINRVVDIASVGGFILTDWKSKLKSLTSVHEEISFKTIDELNYKVGYYLTHEKERLEVAEKLHQDIIGSCNYYHIITFILSKISSMTEAQGKALRLDLGCGIWKTKGFVGVDLYDGPEVDIIADLNRRFPFPDNSVEEIKAHDVIEHLKDNIHSMSEIWRICKPSAKVDIRVPSTDGRGAFQDPTHISFWNLNSFKYYCVEFPAYIELCRSYGFQGAFKVVNLTEEESPDQVLHVRAVLEAVKDTDEQSILERNVVDWNLKEINLVIFPDWDKSEEVLAQELGAVIRSVATHADRSLISLLIHTGNLVSEDAELMLAAIIMELFLQEEIDIAEGPEISFFEKLNQLEKKTLEEKTYFRIPLNNEAQYSILSSGLDLINLPTVDLSILHHKRVIFLGADTWSFQ